METNQSLNFLADCRFLYRATLLDNVAPFWLRHGIDTQYGGIGNILNDAGETIGHDKFLWSQGRALWTFSALFNRMEARPEWKAFADHIYEYLSSHRPGDDGRWMYRIDKEGSPLDRDISIYVDGFALNGLSEYYLASGSAAALELANQTYHSVRGRLEQPGSYGTAPYEIPAGAKAHGVAMLFSLIFYNFGEATGQADVKEAGLALARDILGDFYVESKDAILEYVSLDGGFIDSPAGRACVPGHAIEASWFLISIFERSGDEGQIALCCRLIKRHLELAWDEPYGGLRLAIDIEGKEPLYWKNADCKPWWVQVEALVATLYAYLYTGEDWCLEWHNRVREWAFAHYPVTTGEWSQWTDRAGNKMPSAVLPVKDPFHLPRALMYSIEALDRCIAKAGS